VRLYFLRHGIAADRESWNGSDDERPLTDDGVERMKREARTIAELAANIDLIVTSPLRRARETATIVAKALERRETLVEDERAGPSLDEGNVRAMLADHRGAQAVMFVGHEPSMSETIGTLIGSANVELKKGGLACIDIDDHGSATGTLLWLVPPKLLTR
jgi:phosphohistidine phosphatase